ncbi:MAG: hypothetical protein AB7C97_12370 [Oscillospiraceae bacterium]
MVRTKKFPEKASLNLVIKEHTENSPSRVIPLFFVLTVIILLFARFAVIGPLMKVATVNKAAARAEDNLATIQAYTAGYDAVSAEYARYSDGGFTADELSLVDRLDVLSLVEDELMKYGRVESMSAVQNTITVKLSDVTLEDVSSIILNLGKNDLVSGVNVSNAGTVENSASASVTMTISLTNGGGAK